MLPKCFATSPPFTKDPLALFVFHKVRFSCFTKMLLSNELYDSSWLTRSESVTVWFSHTHHTRNYGERTPGNHDRQTFRISGNYTAVLCLLTLHYHFLRHHLSGAYTKSPKKSFFLRIIETVCLFLCKKMIQ